MTRVLQPQRDIWREREREIKGDLTFSIHFVRQGCGGLTKIAILPQFLDVQRERNAAPVNTIDPTGLYDPTKYKSILAVAYHLNRKQKSIFNPTIPCPRKVPTEQSQNNNLQRMNTRPYPQKKDVDNIVLNTSLHPL